MTDEDILNLYMLQSDNVRKLLQVKNNLVKDINFYSRKSDNFQVEIKTKLLALLYCAWSEAQFIQILFTPSAFSESEIDSIKKIKEKNGISEGWIKMIELALAKVGNWEKNSDLGNRRKELFRIINNYIKKPTMLRNKIAHGQWFYALNRENTSENTEMTDELKLLDYVKIERWFEIHVKLGLIIRDLVQSPEKGFHNNYWTNLTDLQEYIRKTENWNSETKKVKLLLKPISPKCQKICNKSQKDTS